MKIITGALVALALTPGVLSQETPPPPCQSDRTVICPFDRAAIDLCRASAEQREHLKVVTVLLADGSWWQTCGWQYRHDQFRALTSEEMKAPWRRGSGAP